MDTSRGWVTGCFHFLLMMSPSWKVKMDRLRPKKGELMKVWYSEVMVSLMGGSC